MVRALSREGNGIHGQEKFQLFEFRSVEIKTSAITTSTNHLTVRFVGTQQAEMSHSVVSNLFSRTFSDFHDLKLKTRSLHGHKHFTAWEWSMTCKAAQGPDGEWLKREHAHPKKLIGCTLMWWNDQDKIIRNYEYMHMREPEDQGE